MFIWLVLFFWFRNRAAHSSTCHHCVGPGACLNVLQSCMSSGGANISAPCCLRSKHQDVPRHVSSRGIYLMNRTSRAALGQHFLHTCSGLRRVVLCGEARLACVVTNNLRVTLPALAKSLNAAKQTKRLFFLKRRDAEITLKVLISQTNQCTDAN